MDKEIRKVVVSIDRKRYPSIVREILRNQRIVNYILLEKQIFNVAFQYQVF